MDQKGLPVIVALDVEKKGPLFQNPVINVGVAWGTSIDTIQTMSFCFDYKDAPFDKQCYDEFWSKHLDILKRIEEAAKEPKAEWTRFNTLLMELDDPSIEFESDNPAYDIEAIDFHLYTVLGRRLPLRYTSKGVYRSISDSSERIKALPTNWQEFISKLTSESAVHSHWAADDAKAMLVRRFRVDQVVALRNEATKDLDARLIQLALNG